jgi:hypothetical protein
MKYLKRFNEAVSSNSVLEEKLKTIIDSIESSSWAPLDEWEYSDEEAESKKNLFKGGKIESIRFEPCETKLNKLCYQFAGIDGRINIDILDKSKLGDIQVTYDNRGIVVMSGLLNDNPKILGIFGDDESVEDIELEIILLVNTNIIKYTKPRWEPSGEPEEDEPNLPVESGLSRSQERDFYHNLGNYAAGTTPKTLLGKAVDNIARLRHSY